MSVADLSAANIKAQSERLVPGHRSVGPHRKVTDWRDRYSGRVRVLCESCKRWWQEGSYYPDDCS